ncbi:MAG: HAMP domain-containing protein [Campylobacterales bacterium]|nr:HAMP domain-containing protein [Campylobacterales bacterium]
MINKSSIFLTVSLIFLTALISTLFSFIFYVKYDLDVYKERQEHKYYKITKNVIPQFGFCTNYDEFSKQLLEFNLVPITDKKIAYEVLQNSTIVLKKITPFGSIFLVEFKNRYFIYIQSATGNFLYQDEEYQFYRYYLLGVIFLFIELILIFGYVLLIKRLKPLKNLRDELIKFADGDLSAKIEINQNDEIGDVANAFSYLTKRVNELLNSRTLFLRNIMH